jgi:hypothetical protein
MTTHIKEDKIAVSATEDLSNGLHKVITLTGLIGQAQSRIAAGICKTVATSGYTASAVYQGLTKALVGGAVSTVGYPLKVANSGFLVVATSGDVSCGRALTTAVSGDIAPVAVDFLNLGYSITT